MQDIGDKVVKPLKRGLDKLTGSDRMSRLGCLTDEEHGALREKLSREADRWAGAVDREEFDRRLVDTLEQLENHYRL